MNDLLLIIHILAAAAWIGGGLLNGFVAPRIARSGIDGASLAWPGRQLRQGHVSSTLPGSSPP
jgi:hypothetical protein